MKRGRVKRKRSGESRDKRMKKALAGPAKPAAKKQPERRGIVAAARRRIARAPGSGRAVEPRGSIAPPIDGCSGPADARAPGTTRARGRRPRTARAGRLGRPRRRCSSAVSPGPSGGCARWARSSAAAATRTSAVVTPRRAICGVDPRLGRLPRRLPVRRLPQRPDRPARLRGPARRSRRRPRSARRRPGRRTPTCWSRSPCSPPSPASSRCGPGGVASAASSSSSACSASR